MLTAAALCALPLILVLNDGKFTKVEPKTVGSEAMKTIETFHQGCKKSYGPKSCVVKLQYYPIKEHTNIICGNSTVIPRAQSGGTI